MRREWVYILILFFLCAESKVIINEVMANVKGSDSDALSPGDRNEFIELYNHTDSTVNMLDYSISDGDARDFIIMYPESLPHPGGIIHDSLIPPNSYAVILDPEYSLLGDSLYYMVYSIPENAYVFTISNTTFGENGLSSNDCIYLLDKEDSVADTYGTPLSEDNFPYDAGDGISIEKKNFYYADSPNSFSPSLDPSGNSIGRKNSVFIEGAVIDSIIKEIENDICRLRIFVSEIEGYEDNLIVEYEESRDTVVIDSSVIQIEIDNEIHKMANLCTQSSEDWTTLLTREEYNPGTIVLNEFMVQSNEWVEIFNPHSIPFYLKEITLINSGDTVYLKGGKINPEGYVILSKDTSEVKSEYYDLPLKLYECDLFALPDREDTVLLLLDGELIDSTIRGFEGGGSSVERISFSTAGFRKENWDNCIDFDGATPCMKNSIDFRFDNQPDSISIAPEILTPLSPNLFVSFKLSEHSGILNAKIYDDLGTLIEKPISDRPVSSKETIFIKRLSSILKDGLYILYVEIKTDSRVIARMLKFAVRNN
ncbi:MAG: lamin tail domain-containing protein [bacterium]|nr:lamin tail domain-containing protein [bacterium]